MEYKKKAELYFENRSDYTLLILSKLLKTHTKSMKNYTERAMLLEKFIHLF